MIINNVLAPFPNCEKMVRKKVTREYYALLAKYTTLVLKKYYGEVGGQEILKCLSSRRIAPVNPETFSSSSEEDTSFVRDSYKRASSVEEFIIKVIYQIKRIELKGASRIDLTDFLIAVSGLLAENKKEAANIDNLMFTFVVGTLNINRRKSHLVFRVLDRKLLEKVKNVEEINLKNYYSSFRCLVNAYDRVQEAYNGFRFPKIEILHAVYRDAEWAQRSYLNNLFPDVPMSFINETMKDISPVDTEKLNVALDIIESRSSLRGIIKEDVLLELDRIQKEFPYKTYSNNHDLTDIIKQSLIKRGKSNSYKMEHLFIDCDTFSGFDKHVSSEVYADCLNLKDISKITDIVRYAAALGNVRCVKSTAIKNVKVIVRSLNVFGEEITKALISVRKELSSKFNREVLLEVQYSEDCVTEKAGIREPKYIRVIGDIHEEVNLGRNYQFNFGDDFVVNCGDTSGDFETTRGWVVGHMRRGVLISGNHLGYEHPYPELNGPENREKWRSTVNILNTKNVQSKYLNKVLAINEEISFLEKNMWEYNGVTFVGTCLYTDYKLLGSDRMKECMKVAKEQVGDFKRAYIYKEAEFLENPYYKDKIPTYYNHIRLVIPEDYYTYFHKSLNYLKEIIPALKKKKVVIVTHHAPLPQSINPVYKDDPLSASFASDLSEFIKENPQIRLWCHGHTHYPVDYIFGETRVISCPFGYYNENNYKLPYNYGIQVPFNSIKSAKSWRKMLKNEIEKGLIKVYN